MCLPDYCHNGFVATHALGSCAQVHVLPQIHCGDNWEGTLFSWLHIYIYIIFPSYFCDTCVLRVSWITYDGLYIYIYTYIYIYIYFYTLYIYIYIYISVHYIYIYISIHYIYIYFYTLYIYILYIYIFICVCIFCFGTNVVFCNIFVAFCNKTVKFCNSKADAFCDKFFSQFVIK